MAIPFTQYLMPNGRIRPITINRPPEVEKLAQQVIDSGGVFEAEMLSTGEISLTCLYDEQDIAIEVCVNGPPVEAAVDQMIKDAFDKVVKNGGCG